MKNIQPYRLGETVYHQDVYEHREPFKIIGIRENSLELEGDYSGGTAGIIQSSWMPIKGVSRIYNHAYKAKCRQSAIDIETLAIPIAGSKDNTVVAMLDLVHMVMVLTNEIDLNPIY